MLVVALIIIMFALVLPSLKGALSTQRLRKSADLLRAHLHRARIKAMRSGQIHGFHFQMGGTKYVTVPWHTADGTTDEAADGPAGFGTNATSSVPVGAVDPQTLPEGITFVIMAEIADERSEALTEQMPLTLPVDRNGEAPWSPPILFYPDGTASDARVIMRDQRYWTVDVELRGLTGISKVGQLKRRSESDFVAGAGELP
jgi:type II secretory pathway pseudopilin PulG